MSTQIDKQTNPSTTTLVSPVQPILRLENVSKAFGGVVAADDVSFSVSPGQVVGLIGPNGAGKTTILNLISGIYKVDKGDIFINETNVTKVPSHKRAYMGLGRTFQSPRFLYRSRARNNMLLGTDLANRTSFLQSFIGKQGYDFDAEFAMLMQIAGFEFDWHERIDALPYGQQKLLEIVRAMLGHPRCMLVDEPAAGLNTNESGIVTDLLDYAVHKKNMGVLLIEHQMEMVMSTCDHIVVLNFGRLIASGKPQEISTNEGVIEAYLGRPLNVED